LFIYSRIKFCNIKNRLLLLPIYKLNTITNNTKKVEQEKIPEINKISQDTSCILLPFTVANI
jgi:hypothetical protein